MEIAAGSGVPHGQWEDVALDVLLRYEEYRDDIASPNAIHSWLKTTTVRISHEYKNTRIARFETPTDPDELEPDDVEPSPEDSMSSHEGYRTLLAMIDALEPDRRAVFRAYVLEQTPIAAIAAEAGIPEATAYNRLRLARADLQTALERARLREQRRRGHRGFGFVPLFPPFFAWRLPEAARVVRAIRQVARALFRRVRTPVLAGAAAAVSGALLHPGPAAEPPPPRKAPVETADTPSRPVVPIAAAPPRVPVSIIQPAPPIVALQKPHEQPPSGALAPGDTVARGLVATARAAAQRGDQKEAQARMHAYEIEYPDDPLSVLHPASKPPDDKVPPASPPPRASASVVVSASASASVSTSVSRSAAGPASRREPAP